jgi:hypothetical protein
MGSAGLLRNKEFEDYFDSRLRKRILADEAEKT